MIACSGCLTARADGQVVSIAGKRKIVDQAKIDYPLIARNMSLRGTVKLIAVVGRDGSVLRCEVKGGNPAFVHTVIEAVKKWRWEKSAAETREPIEVTFRPN